MRLFITLFLLVFLPAFGEPAPIPDNMSVIVMQAKDGDILYQKRADLPMTPASTTKILTAYTALTTLGPEFRFKTQLYRQGNTLYLRFGGDPSLTSAQLQALLSHGLNVQETQLIIDQSAFQAPWVAGTWTLEDTPWYFATPVHSIIVNENTIPLVLTPSKVEGGAVKIRSLDPAYKVSSTVKAVKPETAETLCQLQVHLPAPHQIKFEGCWPTGETQVNLQVANLFPYDTAVSQIKSLFPGKINSGPVPRDAKLIAEHASAPLKELLKPVLQDSNNLYTEVLTKSLGAQAYKRPSFQAGTFFIENTLKDEFGAETVVKLSDGSGLSRNNLISAKLLAQVLQAAYANPDLRPLFIPALASTGSTGTLKSRLSKLNPPFVGKSGGMAQIATLAGYHDLEGDNPLIYVVMLNHGTEKAAVLRQQVDSTLTDLLSNYFTNTESHSKL